MGKKSTNSERFGLKTAAWISSSFSTVRNLAFYTLGTASFLLNINAVVFLSIIIIGALISYWFDHYKTKYYDSFTSSLQKREDGNEEKRKKTKIKIKMRDFLWAEKQPDKLPKHEKNVLIFTHFVFNLIVFFQLSSLILHQLGFSLTSTMLLIIPLPCFMLALYMTRTVNLNEINSYQEDNSRFKKFIQSYSEPQDKNEEQQSPKTIKNFRTKLLLCVMVLFTYSAASGQWFLPLLKSHPVAIIFTIAASILIPLFQSFKEPDIHAYAYAITIAISSYYSYFFCFTSLIPQFHIPLSTALTSLNIFGFSAPWLLSVFLSIAFGVAFYRDYGRTLRLHQIARRVSHKIKPLPSSSFNDTTDVPTSKNSTKYRQYTQQYRTRLSPRS